MKERIHDKICKNMAKIMKWYEDRIDGNYVPFYSSYDVRDAFFKLGNVDGNIYPAGFNNICSADKEYAPEVIEGFMKRYFPNVKRILLMTEDHLKNLYYWENVHAIADLLRTAGYEVLVGMLSNEVSRKVQLTTFAGKPVEVHHIFSENGVLRTEEFVPDLVISNNDFSIPYDEVDFSKTTVIPARELGWYQRKKDKYFEYYNQFAREFAELIDEDPWLFTVNTQVFGNLDVSNEAVRKDLAVRVDAMVAESKQKYQEHGIQGEPFVVIKNNAGTYGLAVTKVKNGQEVIEWNYKSKKKMKAAKGGRDVNEVILQEGIPSALKEDAATAEPVIYMIGRELVGGFLRTHSQKDEQESLNSPGAVYKRLCLSDLKVRTEGCLLENVYGWVAKLGFLAITREAKDRGLHF